MPLAFFTAGTGMLWLYKFRTAPGSFYDRLINFEADWIGAHCFLFTSAILLIPAALALRSLVSTGRGSALAGTGLVLVMICSFFLAGQYAIDFVMPLIAKAGGAAHQVHQGLFETPLINILFYNLTDLCFVGLILLTAGVARAGIPGKVELSILGLLWALTLAANIFDYPLVGRSALFMLGFAMLPLAKRVATSRDAVNQSD